MNEKKRKRKREGKEGKMLESLNLRNLQACNAIKTLIPSHSPYPLTPFQLLLPFNSYSHSTPTPLQFPATKEKKFQKNKPRTEEQR